MKVQFNYFYNGFQNASSKVYSVSSKRFLSGVRTIYKVWVPHRNHYEWVKADACKVIV